MADIEKRLGEAERALAEMFDVTCDNLCIYSEMNSGRDACPYKDSTEECPIGLIMDKYLKSGSKPMPEELKDVVNDFVGCLRRNIQIVNNIYTQMGYENSLVILKDALQERGYEIEGGVFPEEVFDDLPF